MKHIDLCDIHKNYKELIGKDITVCGWIKSLRDSKQVAFIELNDGTAMKNIQVVIDKATFADTDKVLRQNSGASLAVYGKLVESINPKQPFELHPDKIDVLGEVPEDYPLQKKAHSLEFLRTIPHLRGRTNTFAAVYRVRSQLAAAIHEFFQGRNFTYVHTPILTGSDCEGAGEIFHVTTHTFGEDIKSEEE